MSKQEATTDKVSPEVETATKFKTEQNKYEMRCAVCDELFYVDKNTCDRVRRAVEFDPTDNPFRCDDCEEEYGEAAVS